MRTGLIVSAAAALCLSGATAGAQLTVSTDRSEYVVGDLVQVRIHNAGPKTATFGWDPSYVIRNLDTQRCVYGCYCYAILSHLAPGETVTEVRDSSAYSAGVHRIQLQGSSGDPGSVLQCEFVLTPSVPVESATWSSLKALYD